MGAAVYEAEDMPSSLGQIGQGQALPTAIRSHLPRVRATRLIPARGAAANRALPTGATQSVVSG
jgi:hypothetical protein